MPAFTSIAAGAGALGTLAGGIGSLFGGGDSSGAYTDAAQIQANAARDAMAQQMAMYQQARSDVGPWRRVGTSAATQIGGLLGLKDKKGRPYAVLDPTEVLQATPGYQWLQTQGLEALDRSGLARGMNLSGSQMRGITDFGQNLALTKAWQPYMSELTHMSDSGLTAGQISGNWAMQAGQQQGQLGLAGGQALASGLINSANASQASNQSSLNNMMQSLGLVGGLAPGFARMAGWGGTDYSGMSVPSSPNLAMSSGGWYGSPTMAAPSYSPMPMYADGGYMAANRPAIVGEKGPELFIPKQPGYVVPNYALGGGRYNNYRPVFNWS